MEKEKVRLVLIYKDTPVKTFNSWEELTSHLQDGLGLGSKSEELVEYDVVTVGRIRFWILKTINRL